MTRPKPPVLLLTLLFLGTIARYLAPASALAQASPYVSNLDLAYRDLDALFVAGLVPTIIMSQRPYSRMAFARFAREARDQLAEIGGARQRTVEALERLEQRFVEELAALCTDAEDSCTPLRARVQPREATADVTLAESPDRQISTDFAPTSQIDATVNPLLQRNQGRVLADSWTAAGEFAVDAVIFPGLAAHIRPRVWASGPTNGAAATQDVTLQDAYLRGVFGNFSLELGRNHVVHGHGRQGGPMISHNPRGLDMVRLSLERPVRLPWIFRVFGPVQGSAFVVDMGKNRDIPGSKLIVFELSARPSRNFEFGATLLNLQGGEGSVEGTFLERLKDIFLISPQGKELSDKVLGVDFRLTLPGPRMEIFLEGLVTDLNEKLDNLSTIVVNEAVWVGGARFVGLGPQGRINLWMEGRRAGIVPHTHHQFTSGLTLDDRLIGDPLGPLATGWEVGGTLHEPNQTMSFSWNWERYSGDLFRRRGLDNWERVADNPDEIRVRFEADWSRGMGLAGVNTGVRLVYEHVTRFNFTDANRNNLLLHVRVAYRW